MHKDYLPESQQDQPIELKKLRSFKNPTGRDRKNRINVDFESDFSVRKDQAISKDINQSGPSWDPHDGL